jgi:DNA-directed RNA polymerase I and III subunit RPAC1
MTQVSAAEEARRRFVEFTSETIKNTSSTDYPGVYPGEDHSWNVEHFRKNFRVEFHDNKPYDSTFSIIGIDASVANAFRRILIAEVPTIAIELVFVFNNTSVIQDEVLAQRLGLIPFKVEKPLFEFIKWIDQTGQPADYNCLQLTMDIECDWAEKGKERFLRGEKDPNKLYKNSNGKSRCITKYQMALTSPQYMQRISCTLP